MRHKIPVLLMGTVLLIGCIIYVPRDIGETTSGPPDEDVYRSDSDEYPYEMDLTDFYDYLSPYGVWVSYRPYGYVWIPRHVGYRWRPYSTGRWLWTDYGWTWIADEDWGWAPFHYGRWGWDRSLGWFWVPGTAWAPAWVTWRWGDLYIGWAPLPPGIEMAPGIGIRGPFDFPNHYWVFVESRYFQHDYLDRYALPYERNASALKFAVRQSDLALRNRQIFNDGVDVEEVRRITRTSVSRHELEDARGPNENSVNERSVRIFRPTMRKNEAARPKSYWEKDEAERSLPRVRERDLERNSALAPSAERLKEDQDREMRILEQSQEEEKADLRRRIEDEEKQASTPAEKQKVTKDGEVKAGELRKAHDEEKARLDERHQEEKRALKGTIRKKEGD